MAAIELGVPYYFYTPNQANYFALGAPADANFCGYVNEVTGLDSPGVRENAQVVVAGDGGYHGAFWKDRRPWTMSGSIMPQFPLLARDQAQEKIEGIIMACMIADGWLTWTPADGIQKMVAFRAQQPPRMTRGQSTVDKAFQIACVSADWRVLSWNTITVSATGASPLTTGTAQNLGNADAAPKFVITGPFTNAGNVTITNTITNKSIVLDTPAIAAGTTWTIDLTGTYPTVFDSNGINHDGAVDPLLTDWTIAVAGTVSVANGNNAFRITGSGSSAASGLAVTWRHSWL